jgi:hypothetical protein
MAHDLILGQSTRDWGRGSVMGGDCTGQPRARMGWFGYAMAATIATRILSGQWPWHWLGLAEKRLVRKNGQ